ncbi:hypothetical protein AB1Y20_011830 [Prymnesium parvum]|uniref:AI-2E family transporter n=1 Tax=Prymnesium parvum TaxID=97485 RepID=A0AB34IKY8_PRYPA
MSSPPPPDCVEPADDHSDSSERAHLLPAGARPALLGTDALSLAQARLDERIRTLCLVVVAAAALAAALHFLQPALVRLVLALALKYLLSPLIAALSAPLPLLPTPLRRRAQLPHAVAVLLALALAAAALLLVGLVVCRSIAQFGAHAEAYRARLEALLAASLASAQRVYSLAAGEGHELPRGEAAAQLIELARRLNLTEMLVQAVGTAAHLTENCVYIVLFLAFMLAGSDPRASSVEDVHARADAQIFAYIRGKTAISLLVAVVDAIVLWAVGLDLWLVFSVLTFWLNFIPNVGMASSVCLPMPLLLLDPKFGSVAVAVAFACPLLAGLFAKDVLEPLLIGQSTSLQPVAVLLSIMLWGSVWGVTGMVLAVPITAVARIYLAGLDHPLPRYIAGVLSGVHDDWSHAAAPTPRATVCPKRQ